MSANPYQPHVQVLPEDDANRQIANGFNTAIGCLRSFHILRPVGGWRKVLDEFKDYHIAEMDRTPHRHLVLLIDLDGKLERLGEAKRMIPDRLSDRVFVLSAFSEPERLKADLGPFFEDVGQKLAEDCREGTDTAWRHRLLQHNAGELGRLREHVRPILFPSAL